LIVVVGLQDRSLDAARLFDFAKIVETFDAQKVSFVSGDTSLQHHHVDGPADAQCVCCRSRNSNERVTGPTRIRDKFAASKKRACGWGGNIPLGLRSLVGRKLVVKRSRGRAGQNDFPAIREVRHRSRVQRELDRLKLRTKVHTSQTGKTRGGEQFHRQPSLLDPDIAVFIVGEVQSQRRDLSGRARNRLSTKPLWDAVQARYASRRSSAGPPAAMQAAEGLLVGLLFDGKGSRMGFRTTPASRAQEYRYYLSDSLTATAKRSRAPHDIGEGLRLPAQENP